MFVRSHQSDWLAVASVIVLTVTASAVAPQKAAAFTCESVTNPAGTNAGADDHGDSENTACGKEADAQGGKATAYGWEADAEAAESVAVGGNSQVNSDSIQGIAIGRNARVGNDLVDANGAIGGIAVGRNAQSQDDYAVAVGKSSIASGNRSTAIGKSAIASGDFSTAIGNSANTNNWVAATAIGVGAQASADNEMVFGRSTETYTTPGITSDLSLSRQSGPLEVVTSDANGHLATDGGALFGQINQLQNNDTKIFSQLDKLHSDVDTVESGVAIALSAVGPDLTGAESFGLSLNWGGFEGANAIGGGATGVVYRGQASRLAVTGGIGVGMDGDDAVGGRAGGQLTW